MSLFDRQEMKTINEGINIVRTTKNAVLVDVRSKDDYDKHHVAGAISIPYNRLDLAEHRIRNKETLVYVYGSYYHKPKAIVKKLRKMGFTNIHSCGYYEEHNVNPS